ncbi:hypothetical protein CKF53_14110 [Corynebacterium striatum]|nr:hypothetical protein CKF53_14110 [Corynebacterium striatum]PXY10801.1 hypothetical protein CKF55_00785 [Corynebacterium striatum]PXY12031.1 hypothetical protein CKF74_10730 [Corynebacterium striatum]PXY16408.1 hypothetical protein CKF62_00775 [Corynebacterium striatum]
MNDVGLALRSYFGGASEVTALMTVFLAMPNLRAITAFGTPSASSLLISAQSSMVITLQSSKSAHFSSAATAQFSSAVDTGLGAAFGFACSTKDTLSWCSSLVD